MIDVEYIDDGKRVIIPAEAWEVLKELAEHVQVYELVQQRKGLAGIHSLDDILADEGLSRAGLES
ncbi:MAG: hypothetical protein WB930_09230 [Syntrophobacteraceae bacterium]